MTDLLHSLRLHLESLPDAARAVFAATCAERLAPAYDAYCRATGRGDASAVRDIRIELWDTLLGRRPVDGAEAHAARCLDLMPGRDEEEPWHELQPYAEDAVAALLFALQALYGDSLESSVCAASRCRDSVHHFVVHEEHLDLKDLDRAMRHPLMVQEVGRQMRDVADLVAAAPPAKLRDRAENEAESVLRVYN